MTGTMRLPLGNAVAIPRLIGLWYTMLLPSTLTLIFGKSLIAFTTASMKMGVKVSFSPSRFS